MCRPARSGSRLTPRAQSVVLAKGVTSAQVLARPSQTRQIRTPVHLCLEQPESRAGANHLRLLRPPLGPNFGQRSCDFSLELLCGYILEGLSELLEDLEALLAL